MRVLGASPLGGEVTDLTSRMKNLPRDFPPERVTIGVYAALAVAEQVYEDTLRYGKERKAFGRPDGSLQYSKFLLAEMATELAAALAFTDRAVTANASKQLSRHEASMVKRKSSPAA